MLFLHAPCVFPASLEGLRKRKAGFRLQAAAGVVRPRRDRSNKRSRNHDRLLQFGWPGPFDSRTGSRRVCAGHCQCSFFPRTGRSSHDTSRSMSRITRREFAATALALGAISRRLAGTTSLDDVLRTGIQRRKIPAVAAMVATADKITYQGAFGQRDSSGAGVTPDSIFAIASMTKAITSTA